MSPREESALPPAVARAAAAQPTLAEAFAAEPGRATGLTHVSSCLRVDFSHQHLAAGMREALFELAGERGVASAREAMFTGGIVNPTEGRQVLHVALRSDDDTPEARSARGEIERASALARRLREDPGVRAVVNLGIGGSDLGPAMACRALRAVCDGPEVRFVSNIDPADLDGALAGLDPRTTVFVVASKTFTTSETMHNAVRARSWTAAALGDRWAERFVATTAAPDRAAEWGIRPDRCLRFWDWVGGRFSLSSVVGFPVMVAAGPPAFAEMLSGMRAMDAHFLTAPSGENIPVMHGLVAWMNSVAYGRGSWAVVPYAHDLALLPAFLQQLLMESNGKSVTLDGRDAAAATGPVVWGGTGTDSQHAFFQLLHQGTHVVPVDFIGVRDPVGADREAHDILVANMLAQSAALAFGRPGASDPHRRFPGNRPSTSIFLDSLSPRALGELVALYEHSTAVQGWLHGVNSFDQYGVELGKEMALSLLPEVSGARPPTSTGAVRDAIAWYRTGR